MMQVVQLSADMCHIENQNISTNQKMPRVKLLQLDYDRCYQSSFAMCCSLTPKLL